MGRYRLTVTGRLDDEVLEVLTFSRAPEVLDAIPRLMQKHRGCSCVHVFADGLRLFSVGEGGPAPGPLGQG